jgi:hypothetical protein
VLRKKHAIGQVRGHCRGSGRGLDKGKFAFLNNMLRSRPGADIRAGSALHESALGTAEIACPMSLTREIARDGSAVRAHSALKYSPQARPESRYCTQAAVQRRKRCNDSVRSCRSSLARFTRAQDNHCRTAKIFAPRKQRELSSLENAGRGGGPNKTNFRCQKHQIAWPAFGEFVTVTLTCSRRLRPSGIVISNSKISAPLNPGAAR